MLTIKKYVSDEFWDFTMVVWIVLLQELML